MSTNSHESDPTKLPDEEFLDLSRSREIEQQVLDALDEPMPSKSDR